MIPTISFIESTCCSGGKQPKPPKEKKPKKQKPKKADASDKAEGKTEAKPEAGKSSGKEKEKSGKPSPYQVFEIPNNYNCRCCIICFFLRSEDFLFPRKCNLFSRKSFKSLCFTKFISHSIWFSWDIKWAELLPGGFKCYVNLRSF